MWGDAGEGFIFDTNSLHRAHLNPRAKQQRDAIVYEFNNPDKIRKLSQLTNTSNEVCTPSAGAHIGRSVRAYTFAIDRRS